MNSGYPINDHRISSGILAAQRSAADVITGHRPKWEGISDNDLFDRFEFDHILGGEEFFKERTFLNREKISYLG